MISTFSKRRRVFYEELQSSGFTIRVRCGSKCESIKVIKKLRLEVYNKESIIHFLRLIHVDLPLFSFKWQRKSVSPFFNVCFEIVRVCSFVCCNGVRKSCPSSTEKLKSNETLFRHTRFNAAFIHAMEFPRFLLWNLQ